MIGKTETGCGRENLHEG